MINRNQWKYTAGLLLCSVGFCMALSGKPGTAEQIRVDVRPATPVVLADKVQTVHVQVAVTGFPMPVSEARTPVNVAIVLDRSGSMQGEKLASAKEAAIMAIERLTAEDIVSVVTYDTNVNVLVPATKVSDRDSIYSAIRGIQAGGSTALFAGVSKGASEIRKFLSEDRINRIILLSDGLANEGPSSPEELASLGESLHREGITAGTIGFGLGYNEELMTRLAETSDGNTVFAEKPQDLKLAFDHEFGNMTSVVAKNIAVDIECAPGVRPVQVLGRNDARFEGRHVLADISQIYSDQTKYLILEAEIPHGTAGREFQLADVTVRYHNTIDGRDDELDRTMAVTFTDSEAEVTKHTDETVLAEVVYQVGMQRNQLAMELRDQGKVEESQQIMESNTAWIAQNGEALNNGKLRQSAAMNGTIMKDWKDSSKWNKKRKIITNQVYDAKGQEARYGHLLPPGL